jgi:hypothetical protein
LSHRLLRRLRVSEAHGVVCAVLRSRFLALVGQQLAQPSGWQSLEAALFALQSAASEVEKAVKDGKAAHAAADR